MSVTTSNAEHNVTLKRVGGTGLMGVWVFEVLEGNNRWYVEFIPERLPYARVNMLPRPEACELPENVVNEFSRFVDQCHQSLPVQRLRKPRKTPPAKILQALTNLLLNEEISPDEGIRKEVESVIARYFQYPQFIIPVKGKEHQYWFRSPEMGRFIVTQCPPSVS